MMDVNLNCNHYVQIRGTVHHLVMSNNTYIFNINDRIAARSAYSKILPSIRGVYSAGAII